MVRLLDTGKRSASANMLLDEALLEDLAQESEPILHLYEWESDALTYGHFVQPSDFLDLEVALQKKIEMAKRPTGGGITLHMCDFAFSFLMPSSHRDFSSVPLENYAYVNQLVVKALEELVEGRCALLQKELEKVGAAQHFCMARPTRYDVMIGGRKVGGAAQRKTRHGYLHQGTIFLGQLPQSYLDELLTVDVYEKMVHNSHPLLPKSWGEEELEKMRGELRQRLIKTFCG